MRQMSRQVHPYQRTRVPPAPARKTTRARTRYLLPGLNHALVVESNENLVVDWDLVLITRLAP